MSSDDFNAHFSDERTWQSWLDVEAALAEVQGEAGVIPPQAARDISAAARLEHLDLGALREDIARTMAPVYALSRALARASGAAGDWVHWGATTQNIVDAGRLLVLREVQGEVKARLGQALSRMADLAEDHAETPMVGRTNRQHALPITFGFKVASWIDEALRVCDQLEDCEARLFTLRFGGAIGAFHSLGAEGPRLSARLAEKLGLGAALYEGRAQVDVSVEYVTRLGMIGGLATRVAGEVYEAMQTEVGELSEDLGHGVVGSSTMPHKVNPKLVVSLKAGGNRLRAVAASAFAVTPPAFEGDSVANREMRGLVRDAAGMALALTGELVEVLSVVSVNEAAMARNLAASGDETAMESVMMRLAPRLGRAAAHDLLHAAAGEARRTGVSLEVMVGQMPEVVDVLEPEVLARLFDPVRNTGQSAAVARQLAAAARARAEGFVAGASRSEAATSGSASARA